jgi:hypothetical protein
MKNFYFGHLLLSRKLSGPEWHLSLKIWEIFCDYFVEYIMYTFGLHLFSFNAHDLQVWSFDGISEFLLIPSAALESFV